MKGLRLPTKQINAILDQLDAESSDDHPERRSQRVPFRNHNLIIFRDMEREPIIVVGRNISRHGLSFLFAQYMSPGETIRVVMHNVATDLWTERQSKVVRCRYITNMIHEIGVEFATPLKEDPTKEKIMCPIYNRICPLEGDLEQVASTD